MIYIDIVRSLNNNCFNKLYTRVCIDKLPDRKRKTTRSSIVVNFLQSAFRIYFVS